jgi:hypothetical protein
LHGADSSLPAKEIVCWNSQLSAQTRHNIVLVLDLNNPSLFDMKVEKKNPISFVAMNSCGILLYKTSFGVLRI